MKLGIIDYGAGNFCSLQKALDYLGISWTIVNNSNQFEDVDKFILPGVGSFNSAMKSLNKKGFAKALKQHLLSTNKPILGICLGMQLLFDYGTEGGKIKGFGLLKGYVTKFENNYHHVGWNSVEGHYDHMRLFNAIPKNTDFYFVHGYYVLPVAAEDYKNLSTLVDETRFVSYIEHNNIYGMQFHPEKSQRHGLQLLKHFGAI